MRNPLANEDAAFRWVFGTIVYMAAIVAASWIAPWLGFIVFVLATGVVIALVRRGVKRVPPEEPDTGRAQVEDTPTIAGEGRDERP